MRQAFGTYETAPCTERPVDACFFEGRDVFEVTAHTFVGHDAEDLYLTGRSQRAGFGRRAGHDIDATGDEFLKARRCALGGNPRNRIGINTSCLQHAGQCDVPDTALTRAGTLHFAGVGFGGGDEFLDAVVGRVGANLHTGGVHVVKADRRVGFAVQFGQALPVHHADFNGDDAQGVAVSFRSCDRRVTNHARTAGPVDHIDGNAKQFVQCRADHAARGIGAATCAPRHDNGDRAFRIFRLDGGSGGEDHAERHGTKSDDFQEFLHTSSPMMVTIHFS